eukprot:TRINITY_DN5897_c0_g1_i1.p1 TRINITY_DN5897_c0_g1~~TRINITY_DN5897_c0_g1_i1.p1  ORF type:complete len:234 (-),score=75.27 TRINITY_DN5897_c0_g1_i1:90-701(-)
MMEEFKISARDAAVTVLHRDIPTYIIHLNELSRAMENHPDAQKGIPPCLNDLSTLAHNLKALHLCLALHLPPTGATDDKFESAVQKRLCGTLQVTASRCLSMLFKLNRLSLAKIAQEINKHPDVEDYQQAYTFLHDHQLFFMFQKWSSDMVALMLVLETFFSANSSNLPVLFPTPQKGHARGTPAKSALRISGRASSSGKLFG